MRSSVSFVAALSLIVFLAGCESSEERAEEHYQNALALMAEGDNDRAIVELRNVFALNGSHLEARHTLAKLILDFKGNKQGAYGQYLRLVEQYPDDLEARIALARLAFQIQNWDEVERHGLKAAELAPDNPQVKTITLIRQYRQAVLDEDDDRRKSIAQNALDIVTGQNDDVLLNEVLVDSFLRDRELQKALAQLDILTEQDPTQQRLWSMRLQVLIQLGDEEATETQLLDLVERFPDDPEQKAQVVSYYLARDRLDDTETFLRKLVEDAPQDDVGARIDLIRFLTELRGIDAAKLEIDQAIATVENPVPFSVLKAGLDFTIGNVEVAIDALEGILETAEPGDETNNVKVALARMFLATGNEIRARSLVEMVLAEDSENANALKMNARWLINADEANDAIAALRTALDKEPEDAEALTLMAEAYSRTGSHDLSRDFLSLAVEASNNAPAETIRYVSLLISQERYLPAEDVLLASIRLNPQNPDLLQMAGQLYLAMNDLGRVEQVVQTLQRIGTPEATEVSVSIEAERLNREAGPEEALEYLTDVANQADASLSSRVMLIRGQIATGDIEGAVRLAEELLEENPDVIGAKLVVAATASTANDLGRAEEIYRSVLSELPEEVGVWVQLSQIKLRQGDRAASRAVIEEALALNPNSPQLLWASASFQERDGDIDAAIEIYERLYAEDTGSLIVANNLASLLSTHRSDPDSLERAWTIARRFRDSEIPAIQDTFGWIVHRRGDSEEALPYLQNAARNLTGDALTQFHLAEVYYALGQNEDALTQYRAVLDIAGATDTRPQIAIAIDRLAALEKLLETE